MPLFSASELRTRAYTDLRKSTSFRTATQELKVGVEEQASRQSYDIFLSHSFTDAELILGLRNEIVGMGFSVYVDWLEDPNLSRKSITPGTAETLRVRMRQSSTLLFATSEASIESRWMPWELGYFDGHKGRVAILPITQDSASGDHYTGREYLGLYPYITVDTIKGTFNRTLWVHRAEREYVTVREWIDGKLPLKR